jgi:hypothetical protein
MTDPWLITATHEAGHVYARPAFGLSFDKVAIRPGDDGAVIAAVAFRSAGTRDRGTKRAICCLAGPVAEAAYRGVSLDRLLADTSAADDVEMARAAPALDARAPPFGVVLAVTQRLVDTKWPLIERVTAALILGRELGYREVVRLVSADPRPVDKLRREQGDHPH